MQHTVRRDGIGAAALLLAVSVLLALVPLGYAAIRIIGGAFTQGVRPVHAEDARLSGLEFGLLAQTFGVAVLIGVLATFLAWPCAWLVRRFGSGAMAVLLVPALLPASLVYAGWGLVRAPGTLLGDWIERSAQSGLQELPLVVGRVIAIGGLALWSFPLALLVLAPAVRRIDAAALEMLQIDGAAWLSRHWTVWRLCLPSALSAAALVALVMIGSPVPLHLAQVDTYATRVWLALDRMPESQQWAAWLSAWPLVLAAAMGGWFGGARFADADTGTTPGPSVRERRRWFGASAPGVCIWLLASVIPVLMFAFSVRSFGSYAGFLRVNGDAIGRSFAVAGGVAVVMVVVCVLTWAAAAGGGIGLRGARFAVRLLAVAGLSPGVLVGSWVAGGWPRLMPLLADSTALVVLAHSARFAFVAGLIGLRLAAAEPADRRDARLVDGGTGLMGWARSVGGQAIQPLVGVALIGAVLSGNEIEASIMVAPPGFDTLARRLLDYLHFSRMEELSVASVLLGGTGIVVGVVAAWLVKNQDS